MPTITRDPQDSLLYVNNGDLTARWNFPEAIGSPLDQPAGIGSRVSLTYSFPDEIPAYASEPDFRPFTAVEREATRRMLASIAAIADVSFQEEDGIAQITYAMSSQAMGQEGFAFQPGFSYSYIGDTYQSVTESERAGDVWINGAIDRSDSTWGPGSEDFATLLHETSHALGLKHPFQAPEDGFLLDPELDNERYTVMSYTPAADTNIITVEGTRFSYTFRWIPISPSSLMPLDIQALQHLYGANSSSRPGNDTYRWGRNPEILETLYDTGGTDTIDCGNQVFSCRIDLRGGSYSSIAQRLSDAQKRSGLSLPRWFDEPLPEGTYDGRDNVAIASGVQIERAIGGSGADTLIGNAADNTLSGGLGRDVLIGGGGADRFLFDKTPSRANRDQVKDFTPGLDVLALDSRRFSALAGGPGGEPLPAGQYHVGKRPSDADDHLIYDPISNLLSYAPEGSASGSLLPIARIPLAGNLAPALEDLLVVG